MKEKMHVTKKNIAREESKLGGALTPVFNEELEIAVTCTSHGGSTKE